MRQLPGGYGPTEHSPQMYWRRVRVPHIIYTKVPRDRSLNSSPVLPQSLFIGFSVSVCVLAPVQVCKPAEYRYYYFWVRSALCPLL